MKITGEMIKEFNEENSNGSFQTFEVGIIDIDPSNIVALDFPVEDVINDQKMQRLKTSVDSNGWTNENPGGFSILQFPNGDLAVNGGGNHRGYLSKSLKEKGELEFVKASVLKVVNLDSLSSETRDRLLELEKQYSFYELGGNEEMINERYDILSSIENSN